MPVGVLLLLLSPVTNCATVRKGLQNFQRVQRQLNPSQSLIHVFSGERLFHTMADLVAEPKEFSDVHGMMEMFQWVKLLLKCTGMVSHMIGLLTRVGTECSEGK